MSTRRLFVFFWLLAGSGWSQTAEKRQDYVLPRVSFHGGLGGIVMQLVNFPAELALTPACCEPSGKNRSQKTPLRFGGGLVASAGVTLRPFPGRILRQVGMGMGVAKYVMPEANEGRKCLFTNIKPFTYFYPGEEEYTYTRVPSAKYMPSLHLTYSGIRLGKDRFTLLEIGAQAARHQYVIEQGRDTWKMLLDWRTATAKGNLYGGTVRFKFPMADSSDNLSGVAKALGFAGLEFSAGRLLYELPAQSSSYYDNWSRMTWNRMAWNIAFNFGVEWGPR